MEDLNLPRLFAGDRASFCGANRNVPCDHESDLCHFLLVIDNVTSGAGNPTTYGFLVP